MLLWSGPSGREVEMLDFCFQRLTGLLWSRDFERIFGFDRVESLVSGNGPLFPEAAKSSVYPSKTL